MADNTQILLITVITVLTILFVVIGIQIAYILREFRRTVEKINKILDDAGVASGTVSKSIASLSGVTEGVKSALNLFGIFKKIKGKNNG